MNQWSLLEQSSSGSGVEDTRLKFSIRAWWRRRFGSFPGEAEVRRPPHRGFAHVGDHGARGGYVKEGMH